MVDHLTIEQLLVKHDYFERGHCPTCGGQEIYQALKATMQENERLRFALSRIMECSSDPGSREVAKQALIANTNEV